jgi:hypothetical protein
VAAGVLFYFAPDTLGDSITGLSGRISEDSRSGQYRAFFRDVPASDLLLGRGPKGTWYWRYAGQYQFFDNGYLWMLFIGGLPILLCYITIVLWPAVQALRRGPKGQDRAAVALVLFWALALTGLSTFALPSLLPAGFLMAFFSGRCHLILAETAALARERQRIPASRPAGRSMAPVPLRSAAWMAGGLRRTVTR